MDIEPYRYNTEYGVLNTIQQGRDLYNAARSAYNTAKRVRLTSGNTRSRFESNIRAGGGSTEVAPRRLEAAFDQEMGTIGDPASYRQLSKRKFVSGRKVSNRSRASAILKQLIQSVRYRFAYFNDISDATGQRFLLHRPTDVGLTSYYLPLHLYSLKTVNQGGVAPGVQAPNVAHQLIVQTGGKFFWSAMSGTNNAGSGPSFPYQITAPGDNSVVKIGRKGYLEWSRIRLTLWGKVKNPSNIRVSLVFFKDEEYTPEYAYKRLTPPDFTQTASGEVEEGPQEFWAAKTKYLINGPSASMPKLSAKSAMVTIKKWDINLNPIDAAAETVNSDARGHIKHLDIFHRWNKFVDFTEKTLGENTKTYANLAVAQNTTIPSLGYTGLLRNFEKNVYVMVEAITPQLMGFATAPLYPSGDVNLNVSYDIHIENSWGHIQQLI